MLDMSALTDSRAKSVDLPPWWLEKVRELTANMSLGKLGRDLAEAVGRDEEWDHSQVSRFLRNKNTTLPMAEAFSALLGLPRPFYVPRSLDEAIALTAVAKRYDSKTLSTEQTQRLTDVDALLEAETRKARHERGDMTADEEAPGSKPSNGSPARRVSRRRTPPAGS